MLHVEASTWASIKFVRLLFSLSTPLSPQIVRNDRKLEQIVFPVPSVCKYLTKESKDTVLQKTKCNEQGSKVDDFFKQTQWLFDEMQCQKDLRGR